MKAWTRMVMAGLLIAGCGGDGGSSDPPPDRMVIEIPDAGNVDPPDAAPAQCTATDSYGMATLGSQSAFFNRMMMTGAPDVIFGGGSLNQDPMPDFLQLELYKGFGAFMTGEIRPGTYMITGPELQYASCGVCVRIFTDVNTMTGASVDDYLATGGTVTVTDAGDMMGGGTLAFTLSNITFEHVTINPMTFMSTPHPDMCETAVTSASFSAPIMATP